MPDTTVEIQYCVPCGHLPRALDVQKSLLEHFGRRIEGVKLKTGGDGIFTIKVGGELVYDKAQEFDLQQLIAQIEAKAGAPA